MACAAALYCLLGRVASERRSQTKEVKAESVEVTQGAGMERTKVSLRPVHRPRGAAVPTIDVIQERLESLASRGNIEAAKELARATMRCYNSPSFVAMLQAQMNLRDDSDGNIAPIGQPDPDAATQIEKIKDFERTHCSTLSRETLASLASSAVRNAARLGDADAQLCAIEQNFLLPRARDLSADEHVNGEIYLADYQEKAFERGDWRIVYLMVARTLSMGRGPIWAHFGIPPIDPVSYLRGMQLLRLGADGDYASSLDNEIAAFLETTNPEMLKEDRGLSAQDIADATAWAQTEFSAHFSVSPRLTRQPTPCGDSQ